MSTVNLNDNYEIDAIGESVFSKQWILNCLLNLTNFIDAENRDGTQIDKIEEELCLLWDLSSNHDVQSFLFHHKAHELFGVCLIKTDSPRLAEIFIGILGNLVHYAEIAESISANESLCTSILELLASSDIPFLIQLIRFLNTIIYKQQDRWKTILKQNSPTFFPSIQYLFENSLSPELLRLLFQCSNQFLYLDDELSESWLRHDHDNALVHCLCEACDQLIISLQTESTDRSDWSLESMEFFYNFWLIIQMLFDGQLENCIPRTLITSLSSLTRLFARFTDFAQASSKCLSSFSAACLFFVSFDKSASEQTENIDLRDWEQGLVGDMRCREAIDYFKNLCSSNLVQGDVSITTLANINDFEQLLQC